MKIRIRILSLIFGLLGVLTAAVAVTAALRSRSPRQNARTV